MDFYNEIANWNGWPTLTAIIIIACGYAGWHFNTKEVKWIWLKIPQKQPKQGRLWLIDSSIVRLRPKYPKHGWSNDF
jgi:hypothetical protein